MSSPRRLWPLAAALALTACPRLDPMQRQAKVKAYQPSAFYPDGLGMRDPPAGTIPYHDLVDPAVTTGLGADGKPLAVSPLPFDEALLARGKSRFEVNCAVCHGVLGDGQSQVALNMSLRPPPSLHLYRDRPDGFIFQVITERLRAHALLRALAVGAGPLGGGGVRPGAAAQPARARRPAPPQAAPAAAEGVAMTPAASPPTPAGAGRPCRPAWSAWPGWP